MKIQPTYIIYVYQSLEDFKISLAQRHIRVCLDLHNSDTKTAFAKFTTWINEGVDDIQFTKVLYDKVSLSFFTR